MAQHSFLSSSFPVLLPPYEEAKLPVQAVPTEADAVVSNVEASHAEPKSAFMDALLGNRTPAKDFTENGDMTFADAGDPLVNLFSEMEGSIDGARLKDVLDAAWQQDSVATVKMIWNVRSIHLGKSHRYTFYRAAGWLAQNHPATLLANLRWLVRPVIQKKAPKPKSTVQDATDAGSRMEIDEDSEFEIVDPGNDTLATAGASQEVAESSEASEFDVKFGVAHGYWKDLLNLLYLASHGDLKVDADPGKYFNQKRGRVKKSEIDWTSGRRKLRIREQFEKVCTLLEQDTFYRALHMTVASLFAEQLAVDKRRLESGVTAELKRISLAAKWAPANKGSHDENTFVASTIAELLFPKHALCPDVTDRETYLRQARVAYQSNVLSPLHKHIDIVERHLTAGSFEQIKYDRLPSQAMKTYTPLFARKDADNFDQYLVKVAEGNAKISGATLLPSTMVASIRGYTKHEAVRRAEEAVRNGQWNTLVQRIKNSGTMESSIAVCDVSGSMGSPRFADGSCPLDAAIGLSLVLAEVCKPPFGGTFITFSETPHVVRIDDKQETFRQKVDALERQDWGMSTDFVSVFSDLILPLAKRHNLSQDEMVKRVFVFSDMQFNQAQSGTERWSTSFERIQKMYKEAGYEMPELVFWNLAGEPQSASGVASKPVEADEPGTALVSGYSQGMMKMFMDGGGFDELEDPDSTEETVVLDEKANETSVSKKTTPLDRAMRAISHDAYRMLKVVD